MQTMLAFLLAATFNASAAPTQPSCKLTLDLNDTSTRQRIWGLVQVQTSAGDTVDLPGLISQGVGLDAKHAAHRWWVLPGRATLAVPCKRLKVQAFSGLETETTQIEVDLAKRRQRVVVMPLPRFSNFAGQGWRSGNTHLHLKGLSRRSADQYLHHVPAADGLDVVFLSYLERADVDRDYVSNGYSDADLAELSSETGVLFGSGQEHRHNLTPFGEGYGHTLFLNIHRLIRPVSLGPAIMNQGTDGVPLMAGMKAARSDGATVLWCHNRQGLERVAAWVNGQAQALNIFDGDPADHGSYADTFYPLLNVGLHVPFSTGTDWFLYDFSRVYVQSATNATEWLGALAAGKTFISNGPLLTLQANGKGIGETIALKEGGRTAATARAVGRVDFRTIELVRDGLVVATAKSHREGSHYVAEMAFDFAVTASSWVALRVPPLSNANGPSPTNELGAPLFAHTSPIYIDVAQRRRFDEKAALDLVSQLKLVQSTMGKAGVFSNEAERRRVLDLYERAAVQVELWRKHPELPRP